MTHDLAQLIEQAQRPGGRAIRPAGRLMSVLENEPTRLPELLRAAGQILQIGDPADLPQPKVLLGVTGAPGCGKSTMIDAMVAAYRKRHPEKRVGVISVDPSSPFTGGALLGDRVRMMRHATDPNVFVRSMASRGHLGGLSLGVKGVIRAMSLIGCELVIIETVGVGQSEVEIAQVADNVLVVLAPGQGDSVQLLKAGLMEIGDFFIVNKADRDGAAQLYSQLLSAIHMNVVSDHGHHRPAASQPRPAHATQRQVPDSKLTLTQYACSDNGAAHDSAGEMATDLALRADHDAQVHLVAASDGTGIEALLDALERRIDRDAAKWATHRQQRVRQELAEAILEVARDRLATQMHCGDWLDHQIQAVLADGLTIDTLAQQLLQRAVDAGPATPGGDANPTRLQTKPIAPTNSQEG